MQSREAGKHVGKQSDALERINYLSQVSTFFAERGNQAIARKFNSTLVQIAKKQQVRVPVLVKQTICKSCFSNIDNRVNSSRIRIQPCRERHLVKTCKICNRIYRVPLKEKEKGKMTENQS